MTHSLIRFMLTRAETSCEEIIEAMESGALNIDAAVRDDPSLLMGFLDRQSTIHRKDYEVLPSPAHRQAQCRLVQHMIDLGASPWHQEVPTALKAFRAAVGCANPDLVRMLTDHPDCPDCLMKSLLHVMPGVIFNARFPEILQAMFDAGLDTQARQKSNGNTLLHEADNAPLAKFLLDAGLDPTAMNNAGQDVPAWWDARPGRTVLGRQALDDVLSSYACVDQPAFIAGLGEQWLAVGATVCKARIKSALAMDPSRIRHAGLTLPEMVLARILDGELKSNGEEVKHRKLRRTVLSVMAYCGITAPEHVVPGSGLHTALGIFRQADLGLVQRPAMSAPTRSGLLAFRRKATSATKDATGNTINDLLHLQPGGGIAVDPALSIAWIERATKAGVLEHAGSVVLGQLMFNPLLDARGRYTDRATTLARALVCLARSQLTETWSSYNPTTRQAMELSFRWLDASRLPYLLDQPQALPALLLMFAGTGQRPPSATNERFLVAMRQAVADHIQNPTTAIDPHDSLMVQAVDALKASPVEANVDLGIRVDASIQASLMRESTAPAPVSARSAPRL